MTNKNMNIWVNGVVLPPKNCLNVKLMSEFNVSLSGFKQILNAILTFAVKVCVIFLLFIFKFKSVFMLGGIICI